MKANTLWFHFISPWLGYYVCIKVGTRRGDKHEREKVERSVPSIRQGARFDPFGNSIRVMTIKTSLTNKSYPRGEHFGLNLLFPVLIKWGCSVPSVRKIFEYEERKCIFDSFRGKSLAGGEGKIKCLWGVGYLLASWQFMNIVNTIITKDKVWITHISTLPSEERNL